jgi:hypothetical protein
MNEQTIPPVDFKGLITSLATSAVMVLGQVEAIQETGQVPGEEGADLSADDLEKRVSDGLQGARQLIDTLAVLEEKTEGNLDGEERELLQTALSELRIRFVTLSSRPSDGSDAPGEAG